MDQQRFVVRRVRKILKATSGHGYQAEVYRQFNDGLLELIRTTTLSINQTNIRLRDVGASVWEESVNNCPGWFTCEDPTV